MANLDAVKEAAQALVQMISEADARDMVGKRKPSEPPMPEEPMGEEEEMDAALAEGGMEEPMPEDESDDEMTPEKRKKMLGF